jgi:hypothetical protein
MLQAFHKQLATLDLNLGVYTKLEHESGVFEVSLLRKPR